MAQNSFISDNIDREAMKAPADTHRQNWLPGNDFPIKTTEAFLTRIIVNSFFFRRHIVSN